jgi:glycosyltransferase involved in cell wall biosynthesis
VGNVRVAPVDGKASNNTVSAASASSHFGDPIRVLHCIPSIRSTSGGPTRAVIEMSRAVSEVDSTAVVDIATTDFGLTRDWREVVARRLPQTSSLFVFPQTSGLDAGSSVKLIEWLWSETSNYDVLHIHALFSSTSSICAWIARRRCVPYIVRPLGTLSPYTFAHRKRWLKRAYFELIDKPLLKSAYSIHFTAPQEALKADRHEIGVTAAIIPIPQKVVSAPASGRESATIVFLSRLHPVKGLDLLLHAFSEVRNRIPSARLVIAGSGSASYEQQLHATVEELGVSGAVSFTGFLEGDAKRDLLSRATVFALPSYQENFGLAIVEALAVGLPVVISRQVDLWPEVVEYRSGLVVGNDVVELREALLRLLSDNRAREEMGTNAIRHVKERYSSELVGTQLSRLYRCAVDASGRDSRRSRAAPLSASSAV